MNNNFESIESSVSTHAGDMILPTARIKNDPIKETHEVFDLHFTEEQLERNKKREEMILKRRYKNFFEYRIDFW